MITESHDNSQRWTYIVEVNFVEVESRFLGGVEEFHQLLDVEFLVIILLFLAIHGTGQKADTGQNNLLIIINGKLITFWWAKKSTCLKSGTKATINKGHYAIAA